MERVENLDALLESSDVTQVSVHLDETTSGMINAGVFDKMKPGSFFVNTSRGEIVVEEDLIAAMDKGKVEVAVLDVFNEEPLPVDNPLWEHPRVFVTPHIASVTTPESAIISVAEAINEMRKGWPYTNLVDPDLGY